MKKGSSSESTIIVGPSKSVLVYALHSLVNVLALHRYTDVMPNIILMEFSNEIDIAEKYDVLCTCIDSDKNID